MIIDTFLFHNEIKLLELRLNYLKDIVDKFIIIESPVSFSNLAKPLHASKIVSEKILDLPYDKINICIADAMPDGEDRWIREFCMRNYVRKALLDNEVELEDKIIFGDLDEIPRKTIISNLKFWGIDPVFCEMKSYHYFLNLREKNIIWPGSILVKWKWLRDSSPQGLREYRQRLCGVASDAGWHFTFMGGEEGIRSKLFNFAHIELSNEPMVQRLIGDSKTPDLERFEKEIVTEDSHPDYLVKHIDEFKEMIC